MKLTGNWNYPTTIKFGAGRIKELAAAVKSAGIKKPLLVTDPVLAKLAVQLPRLRKPLILGDGRLAEFGSDLPDLDPRHRHV